MADEPMLDPDNARFASLRTAGPAATLRGRTLNTRNETGRAQVAVSPRMDTQTVPISAAYNASSGSPYSVALIERDPSFAFDEPTGIDVKEITRVFEDISNVDEKLFKSLRSFLTNKSDEMREIAINMPFEVKRRLVFALAGKLARHGADSVLVTTAQNPAGCIETRVEAGGPNEMEQAAKKLTASGSKMDSNQRCPWPANVYFLIQLVYALFAGSYFNSEDSVEFGNSFMNVQKTYFNRLRIAMKLLGPISSTSVCADMAHPLRGAITKIVDDMHKIQDKHERMEAISTAFMGGISFPKVMIEHQRRQVIQARREAIHARECLQDMRETYSDSDAHAIEMLDAMGDTEEP